MNKILNMYNKKGKLCVVCDRSFGDMGLFVYGLGYEPDNPGFESWQGQIFYSSPKLPVWVWGLPILLLNGYRHSFHVGKLAGS
jgi:hypothetical protein